MAFPVTPMKLRTLRVESYRSRQTDQAKAGQTGATSWPCNPAPTNWTPLQPASDARLVGGVTAAEQRGQRPLFGLDLEAFHVEHKGHGSQQRPSASHVDGPRRKDKHQADVPGIARQ